MSSRAARAQTSESARHETSYGFCERDFFCRYEIGFSAALLADPKCGFDRMEEAPKAGVRHPAYGTVLVLYREHDARWLTVRYDAERERARTDREFLLSDAAGFE